MDAHDKDPLALPSPEILKDIAARQDAKAREIAERRTQKRLSEECDERDNAAKVIQKSYR